MLSVHQVLVRPEEQDKSRTIRLRSTIVANLNGKEEINGQSEKGNIAIRKQTRVNYDSS